jgi:hypothetical protein
MLIVDLFTITHFIMCYHLSWNFQIYSNWSWPLLYMKILFPLTKEEKFGLGNYRYDFFWSIRGEWEENWVENLLACWWGATLVAVTNRERSVNFKMSFWCLQIFQKTDNFFSRISVLASKKRLNQKNKDPLMVIGGF